MVDNIPPEELEIEFSGRQIEQLDAIDNAVYQTILTFLNKTEDEFPWDMRYIGEVADAIEGTLLDLGQRVYRPAIITEKDGSVRLEEYQEPILPKPTKTRRRRNLPMSDNPQWEIIQGDALKVLSGFAPGAFDAVITDPPYASGGRTQAEKNKSTAKKYSNMGDHAPPPFDGDAKDQRSWTRWAAEWLYDARKICKPGAPVCMFIDWRQLPAATDALQWAGWIWRGTAVWDKGNSRPQKGRFRQQAEYIVWGSNGDMPISRPVPCLPGVFKYGNPQNRIHLTEKPLQLMRDIVKITEPGGRILDPFAGSGTTVLAAVLEGYSATGIEVTDAYAALARGRIRQALEQGQEDVQ